MSRTTGLLIACLLNVSSYGASTDTSKPKYISAAAELFSLCNASLFEYHHALTAWFSGSMPPADFDVFVDALSLDPEVKLVDTKGHDHGFEDLMKMLKQLHGQEPASIHRPDPTSIVVHMANTSMAFLTFDEHISHSYGSTSIIRTRAACHREPRAASGVSWSSINETSISSG